MSKFIGFLVLGSTKAAIFVIKTFSYHARLFYSSAFLVMKAAISVEWWTILYDSSGALSGILHDATARDILRPFASLGVLFAVDGVGLARVFVFVNPEAVRTRHLVSLVPFPDFFRPVGLVPGRVTAHVHVRLERVGVLVEVFAKRTLNVLPFPVPTNHVRDYLFPAAALVAALYTHPPATVQLSNLILYPVDLTRAVKD